MDDVSAPTTTQVPGHQTRRCQLHTSQYSGMGIVSRCTGNLMGRTIHYNEVNLHHRQAQGSELRNSRFLELQSAGSAHQGSTNQAWK